MTNNLDELGRKICDRLKKNKEIKSAIDAKLAEALETFPLRGRSMTAAYRNLDWLQWLKEEGLEGLASPD